MSSRQTHFDVVLATAPPSRTHNHPRTPRNLYSTLPVEILTMILHLAALLLVNKPTNTVVRTQQDDLSAHILTANHARIQRELFVFGVRSLLLPTHKRLLVSTRLLREQIDQLLALQAGSVYRPQRLEYVRALEGWTGVEWVSAGKASRGTFLKLRDGGGGMEKWVRGNAAGWSRLAVAALAERVEVAHLADAWMG